MRGRASDASGAASTPNTVGACAESAVVAGIHIHSQPSNKGVVSFSVTGGQRQQEVPQWVVEGNNASTNAPKKPLS